jgi:hypothetical protein
MRHQANTAKVRAAARAQKRLHHDPAENKREDKSYGDGGVIAAITHAGS